ncbi:hypothetical protein AJ79_02355 [Helicocarpus griseus UAMH5409]|uniref:DUF3824 domain-containing protein n=1 Tax=Helicocarpus griseus UAMH5409 TaxID=1447875 RepID=A0A2B7Y3G8_9EURO|nr:hypothetical protein AJ79_02355 [Helicocarpus griseus UAMH5409]
MASYYENHPYNTQHRRAQTADFYNPSYSNARPSNGRWGGPTNLVRPDETEDSQVEEIQRDFPPGSYTGDYRPDYGYGGGHPVYYEKRRTIHDPSVRRTHSLGGSHGRRRRGEYYYPRDDDYRRSRGHGHGSRRNRDRYSRRSYSSSSGSRTPSPRPRRRKSFSEQALAAVGLGSAARGHSSRRDRDRGSNRDYYDRDYDSSRSHRRRHRRHSYSRSRSRDRDDRQKEIAQTLKAALTAGAAEAIRARKEPGGWSGEKGKRVLTAAIGGGGVNKLIDGDSDKHNKRHLIESTIAGLATNRLVNGPRSQSRSRGRARSEGRGPKDIASAGLLAAAGKSAWDHYRSKSRGRAAHSDYSDDESSPDRSRRHRGNKKRSKSVSEYLNKGLAALGLEEGQKSSGHGSSRRHDRQRYDDSSDSDDEYSDGYRPRRRLSGSRDGYSRDVGRLRSPPSSRGAIIPVHRTTGPSSALTPHHQHHPPPRPPAQTYNSARRGGYDSDTDSDTSISTDEEERTRKRLLKREILTTGFATIATVNAGHTVAKSWKKRKERTTQLRQGEISPEEARRQRLKNNFKDVASVAVAAIGIKEAADEWKDAAKDHAENNTFRTKSKYRKERRMVRSMSRSRGGRNLSLD